MVPTCESQILAITKFFLGQWQYQMQLLVPFNSFHAGFCLQKSVSLRDIWGLGSSDFWDVIVCSLVGSTDISEESAVTTAYSRGTQDFQKSKSHLKVAIQNLDTWVTWHLGFVHLWYAISLAHVIRSPWDRSVVKLTPALRTISIAVSLLSQQWQRTASVRTSWPLVNNQNFSANSWYMASITWRASEMVIQTKGSSDWCYLAKYTFWHPWKM